MSLLRVALLMFLLVAVAACNHVTSEQQTKALLSEAVELIKRDTDVTGQWANEYGKAFTPENRAKFPANRSFLRSQAVKVIKLLDESSSLNNSAAAKYEQAAGISRYDQQRRGLAAFASGFRKTVEMNELLKSQMQIVSDDNVKDEKLFNEKFLHLLQLVQQKRSESESQFGEAKRLLGWEKPKTT